jgi:hypothetical protein
MWESGAAALAITAFGWVAYLYILRAEILVDPAGITAFGFGMRPTFRAGWDQITETRMIQGETSFLRLMAGRRELDIKTDLQDFDELRRIIEASVPPYVPRS